MIIYEINLTINNDIYLEYYAWLVEHIKVMLAFQGFHKAELAKEKMNDLQPSAQTKITVRYTLESERYLNNYLDNHAKLMREDGIKKFGNQFNATRRIFTIMHMGIENE